MNKDSLQSEQINKSLEQIISRVNKEESDDLNLLGIDTEYINDIIYPNRSKKLKSELEQMTETSDVSTISVDMIEEIINGLSDKVADKLTNQIADRVADKVADKIVAKMANKNNPINSFSDSTEKVEDMDQLIPQSKFTDISEAVPSHINNNLPSNLKSSFSENSVKKYKFNL